MPPLLHVTGLATHFHLGTSTLKAVDGIDFSLDEGETLAIVGESGCGKSMTAYSLMRLVPPPGSIVSGSIVFDGTDLLRLSDREMRGMRGNSISMIFQEPMSSLNPVLTVGDQIMEVLRLHRNLPRREALGETLRLLGLVGIPAPEQRVDDYPHQLSGGMRQRIMIAMALACQPRLLIADEPTTALDVTIQAQILELIDRLQGETGMALLLITHDLGIVAERAHHTAIMYAGKMVESAPTAELFNNPHHPYTCGLLASLPQNSVPGKPLPTIPGHVPNLADEQPGCGFCPRCPDKTWECQQAPPPLKEVGSNHLVRCWKFP
ncbi:ABC transporter ATP-binding protein [Geobacter sp. AOG1]|uniref:ABC transporter ATP-binding protein n=1 Tax=Geobacter sp. AOG1 TaxID=1566346 RepID=UPI001CC52103|nr:ABC transporter ATP-binding protein [Geobacter sp. AOG1]GFE59041.1 dipeptide/oligopeptide/nickel ABC transporter ATP-binding protein [Geobacter sp. AOG1]